VSQLTQFKRIQEGALSLVAPGEHLSGYWRGEDSHFARFTQAKVRQSGSVTQRELCLSLSAEGRRANLDVTLSGEQSEDLRRLEEALSRLRAILPALPEDPNLPAPPPPEAQDSVSQIGGASQIESAEALSALLSMASDLDVVGILMSGTVSRGVFNSESLTRWSERPAHQVDWSVVHSADRAVKCSWAGEAWDLSALEAKMSEARSQLEALGRPAHTIKPGLTRALLSPSAVSELFETLNVWGGWSIQALREGRSPLAQLESGERSFSPLISVLDSVEGVAPAFERDGHLRPNVALIREGKWGGALVSPRSALTYQVPSTGATEGESAQTLSISEGTLSGEEALSGLGTGVYVSDLWYLNFSDRSRACVTGTTRFATMWVEGGEVVAPLSVMRFDDCLYELLGERLEALSQARALQISTSTYDRRSLMSSLCPAALCSGLRFTL